MIDFVRLSTKRCYGYPSTSVHRACGSRSPVMLCNDCLMTGISPVCVCVYVCESFDLILSHRLCHLRALEFGILLGSIQCATPHIHKSQITFPYWCGLCGRMENRSRGVCSFAKAFTIPGSDSGRC